MGIDVKKAQEWLYDLKLDSEGYPVVGVKTPFKYDGVSPTDYNRGSRNMKLGYSLIGYIVNEPNGRQRLINFLENNDGHCGGEALTVTHIQLYYSFWAWAVKIALIRSDEKILNMALECLQTEFFILSLCEVPRNAFSSNDEFRENSPWTPGARNVFRDKTTNEKTVKASREIRHQFMEAIRDGKIKQGKNNQTDQGVWILSALPEIIRKRIATKPRDYPKVQGSLKIRKWSNGFFYAVFKTLPVREGGVRAAGWNGKLWVERKDYEGYLAEYPQETSILVQFPNPNPLSNNTKESDT